MRSLILILTLALAFWSQPLRAGNTETDLPPLADLFEVPCTALDIPKPLVLAIAEVESGLAPWTLNIEGRSFSLNSKEEALAKAREAWVAGRSFDTGLMQVNDWWLRKYGISPEAAIDPLANIYFGGWILKQELTRHNGDVEKAVGAYHSADPARADRYAKAVMSALERGQQPAQKSPNFKGATRESKPGRRRMSCDARPEKSFAAKSSPMLVSSRQKTLAQPQSMKSAGTAVQNPMKVKV